MAASRGQHGHSKDTPKQLGQYDGMEPILVEATGSYEGLRSGERRWVTGTAVDRGLSFGILLEVDTRDRRVERPADVEVVVEGSTQVTFSNTMPVEVTVTEGVPFNPADHNVKDVVAYLKAVDDPAETERVKALEQQASQPRKTILDY